MSQNINSGKQRKKDVTETQGKKEIKEKEAIKRKTKEVCQQEIKKKGEVRKKDEEETTYEVEKLLSDRKFKGVWEIEVKWKDDVKTTWEPMKNIKLDQPKMVEHYMDELCKEKKAVTTKKRRQKQK